MVRIEFEGKEYESKEVPMSFGEFTKYNGHDKFIHLTPIEEKCVYVPENIKIENFGGTLYLQFGKNQSLYCNPSEDFYCVANKSDTFVIPCCLVPCEQSDLKNGDIFCGSYYDKPNFSELMEYNIYIGNDSFAYIENNKNVIKCYDIHYSNLWRVVPKTKVEEMN